jgi:hypothetical protein
MDDTYIEVVLIVWAVCATVWALHCRDWAREFRARWRSTSHGMFLMSKDDERGAEMRAQFRKQTGDYCAKENSEEQAG